MHYCVSGRECAPCTIVWVHHAVDKRPLWQRVFGTFQCTTLATKRDRPTVSVQIGRTTVKVAKVVHRHTIEKGMYISL